MRLLEIDEYPKRIRSSFWLSAENACAAVKMARIKNIEDTIRAPRFVLLASASSIIRVRAGGQEYNFRPVALAYITALFLRSV